MIALCHIGCHRPEEASPPLFVPFILFAPRVGRLGGTSSVSEPQENLPDQEHIFGTPQNSAFDPRDNSLPHKQVITYTLIKFLLFHEVTFSFVCFVF